MVKKKITETAVTRIEQPEPQLAGEIQAIIVRDGGKCDALNDVQRVGYLNFLCAKACVDPTLRPFDLIPTKNGLRPYANKDCAALIRDGRGVSVTELKMQVVNNICIATASGRDRTGRVDTEIGACPMGEEPHNNMMKAVTKAKRRLTLSLCRLGSLVEESHPSEYANGAPLAKTKILLEDEEETRRERAEAEAKAKHQFAEACKMKTTENLAPENLQQLLSQVQRASGQSDIVKCAEWVTESKLSILVTKLELEGEKTSIASFKEKP